jgi:tetratricopeptide (TPR) repeat protein
MPVQILKTQYFLAAIPYFRDGLAVFPQDENMLVRLAQTYDGLREYPLAEQFYQKAIQVDPRFDLIFQYYATHLAAEGKQAEAADLVKKAREMEEKAVDSEKKSENALQ